MAFDVFGILLISDNNERSFSSGRDNCSQLNENGISIVISSPLQSCELERNNFGELEGPRVQRLGTKTDVAEGDGVLVKPRLRGAARPTVLRPSRLSGMAWTVGPAFQ